MIGYPCFRFRITGHYFALVTLALSEVVRLLIVALRDYTGGSLGVTPRTALADSSWSLYALQFADKEVWFYIVLAFWAGGLVVWRLVDRSMARFAMEAISQEEDAAAAVGIDVTRTKLEVTLISAAMTAMGGALYGQYQVYINPETVSGIAISLQIVFAVIAGGMFVQLGPTVGAVFTLLLAETLRVTVGHDVHGLDGTIYGLMLVLFIIYMPKGILGKVLELSSRRGGAAPPGRLRPPPKAPRSDGTHWLAGEALRGQEAASAQILGNTDHRLTALSQQRSGAPGIVLPGRLSESSPVIGTTRSSSRLPRNISFVIVAAKPFQEIRNPRVDL